MYDQNLYDLAILAGTVALYMSHEGLLLTVLLIMMKKVASSKKHTQFKTRVLINYTLFKTKMAKNSTLFMTKTTETPYPL